MFLDYLKLQGQKVIDKYAPENKLGRINVHNVFWMVASIAVFYYTDFYIALRIDPNIKRYTVLLKGDTVIIFAKFCSKMQLLGEAEGTGWG